ncbi:M15 family metallopeptidase [Peptoniphilus catoniae]|uniref:M15 family metallopeptidase n=1 Tax=Peptoniphilus catoniae TaxID=1660341 RepID=UPI0010FDBFAE|nr:M15 family metallopeptidase [Peptoniphilus catoniae]
MKGANRGFKKKRTFIFKLVRLILTLFIVFIIFPRIGVYSFIFDRGSYRDNYFQGEIISDLEELSPNTKKLAYKFLERCEEEGLSVIVTETYRTQERQEKLYAQGRTEEGNKVTWTRNSNHTKRHAFDIAKAGSDPYGDMEFFRKCADIALEVGLTPGYYFKTYKDPPHMEFNAWWLKK